MIFVLKQNTSKVLINKFREELEKKGFKTLFSQGTDYDVIGLVGNTSKIDIDQIVETNPIIAYGKRITEHILLGKCLHLHNKITKFATNNREHDKQNN